MPSLRSALALPWVYRLFGRLVGGDARSAFVRDYLKVRPGQRILDIGCGPADLLACLPEVDYVGIDLSAHYIEAARARYGKRGRFICESVADTVVREPASADLVTAMGVLHHLDDAEARRLLEVARQALKPGGRFVALDGVWHPDQSRLARWVLSKDRGRFIRTAEAYVALARDIFASVASHVRHDMIRIPYSHHIMICSQARPRSGTKPPETRFEGRGSCQ
jgi:SAM-dependent methyltransferase